MSETIKTFRYPAEIWTQLQILLLILSVILGQPENTAAAIASPENDLFEESQEERLGEQQGSWSHWWSYDGISGPDYWNINKRWRLCGSGRQQSPIDVRTERLVYDHLLGPLQLDWLEAGDENLNKALEQQQQQRARPTTSSPPKDTGTPREPPSQTSTGAPIWGAKSVKVQLLNSGRGIEAWLEPSDANLKTNNQNSARFSDFSAADQLILSGGPLSYAYKLFKMELHSAVGAPAGRHTHAQPTEAGAGQEAPQAATRRALGASEHLVDGRSFDAELQLHFYNKHLAGSAREALQAISGELVEWRSSLFAVISVFVLVKNETGSEPGSKVSHSPLDFLLDGLSTIPNQGNQIELELERQTIEALVANRQQYVTYQGSLNRPPCAESVDWILVNQALRIEAAKFDKLISGSELNTNQENVRPTRPLNGRHLRTSINNLGLAGSSLAQSATECSAGQKNCTSSKDTEEKQQQRQASCNMRPNYIYQLRH